MKIFKRFLCVLVIGFACAGAYSLLFPRGHAKSHLTEEEVAHIASLGIEVDMVGHEGGVSAVLGKSHGLPSLTASVSGGAGNSIPSFMLAEHERQAAPAFIAAEVSPSVAQEVAPLSDFASDLLSDSVTESVSEDAEKKKMISDSAKESDQIRLLPPVDEPPKSPEKIVPRENVTIEPPRDLQNLPEVVKVVTPSVVEETRVNGLRNAIPLPPLRSESPEITPAASNSAPAPRELNECPKISENPEISKISAPSKLSTETTTPLREKVVHYVQAQCVLIDSGEPQKVCAGYVHLSQLYEHHEMSREERRFLEPILEQLAHEMIYSRDVHILEPPYTVRAEDTLESIAAAFEISPQLLRRINGIDDAALVQKGMQLKVVRGPFDAKLLTAEQELYLVLGGLYAGRAEIIGQMPQCDSLEGDFAVQEKAVLAPGVFWIGLGGNTGLISTNQIDRIKSETVFVLPTVKMAELHDILQAQSTVSIVR